MRTSVERAYIIFDGDCGICTYCSEVVQRRDGGRSFEVVPYQRLGESKLTQLGLSVAGCSKRMYVVSRTGRIYPGAFGVNYILFKWFPWSILVVLTYALPILLVFELIGYRLVANNRHRLSHAFGLKACLIRGEGTGDRLQGTGDRGEVSASSFD